jgi:hypothetical protein
LHRGKRRGQLEREVSPEGGNKLAANETAVGGGIVTETEEQKAIIAYFRERYPQYAMSLRVSQSGGYRGAGRKGAIRTAQVTAMGGVTGEADIAIMLPRQGFGSLVIEHKAAGSAHKASDEQVAYIEYHRDNGNCAVITRGVDMAITAIDTYMSQ